MSLKARLLTGSLVLFVFGVGIVYVLGHKSTEPSAEEPTKTEVPIPVATQKSIPSNEAEEEQVLALEIALQEFESLEAFNARFSPDDTPDVNWLIPDTSEMGSEDGGKTHGWTSFPSKEEADDSEITDTETGEVTAVISAKDGATAGEIRQILSERDAHS
jgi:hypothetical protein